MLTERLFRRPLARAQALVAAYQKDEVMERPLKFLNDEAWWGFRSSPFGEERATQIARGTSCPIAVLARSAPRESRRKRVPWLTDGGCAGRGRAVCKGALRNRRAPSLAAPTAAHRRRRRSADTPGRVRRVQRLSAPRRCCCAGFPLARCSARCRLPP